MVGSSLAVFLQFDSTTVGHGYQPCRQIMITFAERSMPVPYSCSIIIHAKQLFATCYLLLANRCHLSSDNFFIFPIDILKFICYFETVIGVISQL